MTSTRWRASRRLTFAGAGDVDLYLPTAAGDVLNVRQLVVSTDAAAEVVVFFSESSAAAGDAAAAAADAIIFGAFLAANGGAAPDLSCVGAWAPKSGQRVRLYCSAAAHVIVAVAGLAED